MTVTREDALVVFEAQLRENEPFTLGDYRPETIGP
jgi:hypothetical protein